MRKMNDKQHRSLDRLADRDPFAVVVGWSTVMRGPIILTASGEKKVCPPTGYLRKLA